MPPSKSKGGEVTSANSFQYRGHAYPTKRPE
jgi:hypothetical protein